MKLKFSKMSGAGNDFVVIDDPSGELERDGRKMARALCMRRTSVGADGLIIIGRSGETGLSVAYFNPDGSRAACGNGYRCAARFIQESGLAGRTMKLATDTGTVSAEVRPDSVKVLMPDPVDIRLQQRLTAGDRSIDYHFAVAGVPHVVIEVPDVDETEVVDIGRVVRHHSRFSPEGTNVDFVSSAAYGVKMRTYERGVEDETLACGTGAVASAAVLVLLEKVVSPVSVTTRSGNRLVVSMDITGGRPGSVWLEGPADLIYTGSIDLPSQPATPTEVPQ